MYTELQLCKYVSVLRSSSAGTLNSSLRKQRLELELDHKLIMNQVCTLFNSKTADSNRTQGLSYRTFMCFTDTK